MWNKPQYIDVVKFRTSLFLIIAENLPVSPKTQARKSIDPGSLGFTKNHSPQPASLFFREKDIPKIGRGRLPGVVAVHHHRNGVDLCYVVAE